MKDGPVRWFLDLLRGRKRREAEEALERLDQQSEQGLEAAQRFEEAARRVLTSGKRRKQKT